jgi:hypothetical protein
MASFRCQIIQADSYLARYFNFLICHAYCLGRLVPLPAPPGGYSAVGVDPRYLREKLLVPSGAGSHFEFLKR